MTTRVTLANIANREAMVLRDRTKANGLEAKVVKNATVLGKRVSEHTETRGSKKKRVEEVVGQLERRVEEVVDCHLLQLPRHFEEAITIEDDLEDKDNNKDETVDYLKKPEYLEDILCYLQDQEQEWEVKQEQVHGTMAPSKTTGKMRALVVDWLVEVHQQFVFSQDTLHLNVALMDRFLATREGRATTREELQLVGVTAAMVAAKVEERELPLVGDFAWITDDSYTPRQVLRMERRMLAALEWRLTPPLPTTFLGALCQKYGVAQDEEKLAVYVLELALLEQGLVGLRGSRLATAALQLVLGRLQPGSSILRDGLEEDSGLEELVRKLKDVLERAGGELGAVREKYGHKR